MSSSISVRSSLGFLCYVACALALGGCASLKVTPQPSTVVDYPPTVILDAGNNIVPNTAKASVDGQNVPLTCVQFDCSSQPLTGLAAGMHTVVASIQETCATCNPNPITLNNDLNNAPSGSGTQFAVRFTLGLSPVQFSIQQGQSATLLLTDTPVLNVPSDLTVSGVSGVTVSPGQAGTTSPLTTLTLSVGSSVPPGNYTVTIKQAPVGSSLTPAVSGTVALTVTGIPSSVQTGPFVEASFTTTQAMSGNGQFMVEFAPAPPVGSNAPNAPNTAQFFTVQGNQPVGSQIGFYPGGGAAFCPASDFGAVMTPVPPNSGLGTTAQAIYFLKPLLNPGSSLPAYDAFTNGSGGATAPTSLWFSPDCSVLVVEDIDPTVGGTGQKLRAQFFQSGILSPFHTVHYNTSISVNVVSGGSNGELQITADNGSPTTFPIP